MTTYSISHINGPRCADELVIYNTGVSTGTNAYGIEASVCGGVVVDYGANNKKIPENGFVISGHGSAALFIEKELCEGARVTLDLEKMTICCEKDDDSLAFAASKYAERIEARANALAECGQAFDADAVSSLLEKSRLLISEKRFDEAKTLLDECYCRTSLAKPGEVRGVWHRPTEQNIQEVRATVKRLADAGFNLMLIETNYEGRANALKCVSDYLPAYPEYEKSGFDVIAAFIEAGKEFGVKMHAWVEDFFFGTEGTGCRMMELHPELMARTRTGSFLHDAYKNFYFLNPSSPQVHGILLAEYRKLLDNYDFDGVQLDYIRYPIMHDIDNAAGFEDETISAFKAETGIDAREISSTSAPEWDRFTEWRSAQITKYVKSVAEMINEYRLAGRNIQLSTAVFGNPVEAIRLKCQNWLLWTKEGWLDFISPMAYLRDAEDVGREVGYMVENYGETPNVAGIAPTYQHLPAIEATKQVEACRAVGAIGVAIFESKSCTDELIKQFKYGVFRKV